MTVHEQIETINRELVLNGRLDEAERALNALAPETQAGCRQRDHFLAILRFSAGDVRAAKAMMERTLDQFGENLNLLRDLVVCKYHLNDMMGFRDGLNRLELLLIEHEAKLSSRTLLECELMLGKFLEEEARLAPALLFYERALNRVIRPEQRLRVLVQKARWHALYEYSDELSQLYRDLISYPADSVSVDLKVELEHSLMLIELRLIGSDHAWQRIVRVGDGLNDLDQRLLVFDFLEGALSQDLEVPVGVLERVGRFAQLDPFEDYLRKLLSTPLDPQDKIHELTALASKLPWALYLRLLCLTANQETHASAKQELNRKIQLIIRGLDPRSQTLWNQRLKQALQTPETKLEFCARSRTLRAHGKSVDLSKKKMGLQLLAEMVNKPHLTVDEAIQLIWNSSFSPEHYHRLRMGIHRLNTLVNESTGLGKIVEVDSQTVRLRPEVRLRVADDFYDMDLAGL